MNQLATQKAQLPDTIEELSQFVFIGRERLTALKAAIKACSKSEVIAEKLEQMKEEEQGLAEAVLLGETKIGELLLEVPRDNPNKRLDSSVHSYAKAKEEIGISQKQAQRYQVLAKHPEAVEEAIQEAKNSDRAVTRQDVLRKIAPKSDYRKKILDKAKEEHDNLMSGDEISIEAYRNDQHNMELLSGEWIHGIKRAWENLNEVCKYSEADIRKFKKALPNEKTLILTMITESNLNLKKLFEIFMEED